ncbi:hypothetical protein T439DRAFT_324364 [Meredithblackwellia eburnea MCA 4105]
MFSQSRPQQQFSTPTQQSSFTNSWQQQTQPHAQQPSFNTASSSTSGAGFQQQPPFGQPQFGQQPPFGQSGQQFGYGGPHSQPQFGAGGAFPVPGSSSSIGGGGIGTQQQQNQGQGGGNGTPGGKKYLPGYLSSANLGQSEATPPQGLAGDDSNMRSWDSPVRSGSVSGGSPVSRFGQSLFAPTGRESTTPSRSPKANQFRDARGGGLFRGGAGGMEDDDAPPIDSLGELDGADTSASMSFSPPFEQSEPLRRPALSHTPSSTTQPIPQPQVVKVYPVYIFGFPSSALSLVLDHFTPLGTITRTIPSPEGGNWVTIDFVEPWAAMRAARKNGEVLGGVLMIGVKVVDEEALRLALAGEESGERTSTPVAGGSSTPAPANQPPRFGTPSGGGVGKPITVLGPSSAFKPPAPTPPRRGLFGVGGGGPPSGATPTDPHASLFAEKNRQALAAKEEQKGMLGKVSDLVFGW